MSFQRIFFGNTEVNPISEPDLLSEITKTFSGKRTLHLLSANLQHIGLYNQYGKYYHKLNNLKHGKHVLTLIDGMPVLTQSNKFLNGNFPLLAGSDLFPKLLNHLSNLKDDTTVLFFGGEDIMLKKLELILASAYPKLNFHYLSPSREDLNSSSYLKKLKKDLKGWGVSAVFLNLPKPISDLFALEHFSTKQIKLTASFGAAADFYVGHKVRAPQLFRKLHSEWLYRLLMEPKRLFKRYIVEGPKEYFLVKFQTSNQKTLLTPQVIRNHISRVLLLADTFCIIVASIFSAKSRHYLENSLTWYSPNYFQLFAMGSAILFISFMFRSRTPNSLRIESELYLNTLIGTVVSISAIGFFSYLFQLHISRGYLIFLLLYLSFLQLLSRALLSGYLTRQRSHGALLVQASTSISVPTSHPFLSLVEKKSGLGYYLNKQNISLANLSLSESGVIITAEEDHEFFDHYKYFLGEKPELILLPRSLTLAPHRIAPESFGVNAIFHLLPVVFSLRNRVLKRVTDLTLSLTALLFLSPILLITFILIKLEDGGPAFFTQIRIGKDNKEFKIYKFRTMVPDAENMLELLRQQNEGGSILFKIKNDPRITRIGYYLRKYSIDELPQLLNVLEGKMSLVGPRPALIHEVKLYDDLSMMRHYTRPGITGLWQVSGRSEIKDLEALELDLHYIANWSLYQDFIILLKTFKAVFTSDGAY